MNSDIQIRNSRYDIKNDYVFFRNRRIIQTKLHCLTKASADILSDAQ